MSDDPIELARQCLALGGADVNECDVNTLARAVLQLAEERDRSHHAALYALRQLDEVEVQRNTLLAERDIAREQLARLKAALLEACDLYRKAMDLEGTWADESRVSTLRRIAEDE